MQGLNLPAPQCAKCGRSVDRMYLVHDVNQRVIRATAHCHGAQEECALPLALLQDPDVRALAGVAFASAE